MDTNRIMADLRKERDRIDQAIGAIEALNGSPVSSQRAFKQRVNRPLSSQGRKSSGISAAGRKRISEAAKKMWEQRRKQGAPRSRAAMSAETKKKLSQAAKARWAERKKKTT